MAWISKVQVYLCAVPREGARGAECERYRRHIVERSSGYVVSVCTTVSGLGIQAKRTQDLTERKLEKQERRVEMGRKDCAAT